MDTFVMVVIGAAWVAIFGMFLWGVVGSWRRMLSDEGTLPLFGMLERRGLERERLGDSESFFGAVRRCAMCRERARCAEWLDGREVGAAPACPNADFMDRAARG